MVYGTFLSRRAEKANKQMYINLSGNFKTEKRIITLRIKYSKMRLLLIWSKSNTTNSEFRSPVRIQTEMRPLPTRFQLQEQPPVAHAHSHDGEAVFMQIL